MGFVYVAEGPGRGEAGVDRGEERKETRNGGAPCPGGETEAGGTKFKVGRNEWECGEDLMKNERRGGRVKELYLMKGEVAGSINTWPVPGNRYEGVKDFRTR